MRPCTVSTRKMRPGCSRSLSRMFSGGMSSTPTSDAMIDEVVLRHVVARRPQAVAIEHRADDRAVGEGDRRRAVPRLHQRRVVLVERLQLGPHALVARPRLGNHHQDGVRQRPPGHHQELEHVVERRRVAAALADDRQDLLQIVAEQVRAEQPLARAHPVDVAAQRVDLAVVRDVAVRVRQRPRRERVGAEALVDERQRRLDVGIEQIGERALDLIGDQHALVDQRLRRQARDVERVPLGQRRGRRPRARSRLRMTYSFRSNGDGPGRVGPVAVAGRVVARAARTRADEDLLDDRLGRERRRRRCRRRPSARSASRAAAALLRRRSARRAPQPARAPPSSRGRKTRPAPYCPAGGSAMPSGAGDLAQEPVRHLNQDAGAVAGVRLAAARAAVQQVDEDLQPLLDDAVRAAALDVDDEADAAGVVLVARIVQADGIRSALRALRAGGRVGWSDIKDQLSAVSDQLSANNSQLPWIPSESWEVKAVYA